MSVSLYFGLPGSGKTTFACMHAYKAVRSKRYKNGVYSNFPCDIEGVTIIENEDIGKYDLDDALILLDEASLYADNRQYKNFTQKKVEYFLLHRHHNNDVFCYTQGYNGVDKKIRTVTDRLYWIRKCPIRRYLSKAYKIPYGIGFTSTTEHGKFAEYGDICEGYKSPDIFSRLFAERCHRRKYYKYFDSWECEKFPSLPPRPHGTKNVGLSWIGRLRTYLRSRGGGALRPDVKRKLNSAVNAKADSCEE